MSDLGTLSAAKSGHFSDLIGRQKMELTRDSHVGDSFITISGDSLTLIVVHDSRCQQGDYC